MLLESTGVKGKSLQAGFGIMKENGTDVEVVDPKSKPEVE